MFDVGGGELVLIVLAIILLFGPKKIPEMAQMIRKGMTQFYKAQNEIKEQINNIKSEIETVAAPISEELKSESLNRTFKEIKTDLGLNEESKMMK